MQKVLRVMQVLPNLNSGGVERGVLEIANALCADGHKAFVCSNGGKMVESLQLIGATHIKLPTHTKNPIMMLINALSLAKYIKINKIDVVHARSRAPAWSCYLACKITGAKFVTTFHGTYGAANAVKRFYNSVMLKGDRVIAISDFIYRHILEVYKSAPRDLYVINRGVDVSYFCADSVSTERVTEIKRQLSITEDMLLGKKVILLPSRFARWKGQVYFLKILSMLQRNDFLCIMVGAVESKHNGYIDEINSLIARYQLQHKVLVKMDVQDMPALYSICDFVVSASTKPEAFGRTIVEAQSMGKIVIATNKGGATEKSITHGKTGFHIPDNDASSAAEIVLKTLSLSNIEYQTISHNAMENCRKNFSIKSMCNSTIKLYEQLI